MALCGVTAIDENSCVALDGSHYGWSIELIKIVVD